MHCQKCRAPLKLDSSLEDLNPAAFNLLVGSQSRAFLLHELTPTGASPQQQPKNISSSRLPYPQERKQLYDRVSKNAPSPTFRRTVKPSQREEQDSSSNGHNNPAMSFVMLSESQVVPQVATRFSDDTKPKKQDDSITTSSSQDIGKALSQDMERETRLFEILSARSDIDHPVCIECTDLLVARLQERLGAATKERDAYVTFLKQVNSEIPTDEETEESREALSKAQAEEETAIQELKKLEAEKQAVDDEIALLEEEAQALDIEEEKFWYERNAFAMKLAEYQNVRDSVNLQYDHDSQLLEKLQRTNVYNDTFCISHDGKFGTINGLRLGRLSNVPVDWPEINAAWGHTVLLLQTVADKLGFKFDSWDLQPMGSTSRVIKYDAINSSSSTNRVRRTAHELYSSGDMPLGLTFMHRRFDNAMVAFLECMRQLGDFVEQESARGNNSGRGLALPYMIEGEKIGDVSIKLGIAQQDDSWSRACKFTLTNCKFLLAHASNVNAALNSRRGT